jgi:2-polyprenyl-3-methyl-5-hydroxy-6-metoxy-1,4-benzoquinol methylase
MTGPSKPDRLTTFSNRVKSFYNRFNDRLVKDYLEGNRRVDAQVEFLHGIMDTTVARVLVVGCGNGLLAFEVADKIAKKAQVLAIDISPKNIETAKHLFPHHRIEYQQADVLKDSIAGNFEAIVLPDVYEHIPVDQRDKLHKRLAEMMSKSASLLLTFPSEFHQQHLFEQQTGLQIVDEIVVLEDIQKLAQDVLGVVTYYNLISVWNRHDYVHAVIDRQAQLRPLANDKPKELKTFGVPRSILNKLAQRWLVQKGVRTMRRLRWFWILRRMKRMDGDSDV